MREYENEEARQLEPGEKLCTSNNDLSQDHNNEFETHEMLQQIQVIPDNTNETPLENNGEINKEGKVGWWKSYRGLVFASIAGLMITSSSLISKILGTRHHVLNISTWGYQGMTSVGPLLLIYFRLYKKQPIFDTFWLPDNKTRGKTFILILIRATLGTIIVLLGICALQYLSLADFVVLKMTSPIVITLFARICLGEPCGFIPMVSGFLTLVGVCILSRPPVFTGGKPLDMNTLIGIGIALILVLVISCVFLLTRFLRTVHFSVIVFTYGYIGTIESIILSTSFGVFDFPKTQEDWIIATLRAVLSLLGQLSFIAALKYEQAGPVSLIKTSEVVFSFILQFIFLGVIPDWFSLVGGGIVMSSLFITTLRKWLTTLPVEHSARTKYKFLLK